MQEVFAKYISDLKSIGVPYEIIAVDDGCTDASGEMLVSLARLNRTLRVVKLDGRYGKQAAITAGMDAADPKSSVVILADVDILNPTGVLKKVVDEYTAGHKIVYAKRELYGSASFRSAFQNKMVKIGLKMFGIEGTHTGKVNVALYARDVADIITAIPEKNKFMRTMDNWVGWKIKYISYASGYNKAEQKEKMKELKQKLKPAINAELWRDKNREHTPSMIYAGGMLALALVLFFLGIYFAVGLRIAYYYHLIIWLGFVASGLIAPMFYARAVLIKRIGIIHTDKTEKIYTIKSVVN